MQNKKSVGYLFLMIIGLLILVILFLGQMMSFIDYDFTVSIGLQEAVEIVGEMGVAVNKGFGVGDTIIYTPLLLFGLLGLWFKRKWGVVSMIGALAITAYWPVVSIFIIFFGVGVPGFNFTDFTSYVIVLTLISLYGIWGIWFIYKNQNLFINN